MFGLQGISCLLHAFRRRGEVGPGRLHLLTNFCCLRFSFLKDFEVATEDVSCGLGCIQPFPEIGDPAIVDDVKILAEELGPTVDLPRLYSFMVLSPQCHGEGRFPCISCKVGSVRGSVPGRGRCSTCSRRSGAGRHHSSRRNRRRGAVDGGPKERAPGNSA